jgi:3-hydroxyisobutyrate dehydrogenase-like beta-hydroxyacid dehydrogenase
METLQTTAPKDDLTGVRIGFVGLGLMGAPIAANLARAGADLTVWNRTVEKADALAERVRCTIAATPAELARRSDVIVTMLADGDVLEELYFADGAAVARALGEDGLAIDMSTIGPLAARSIAERLAEHGVRFVDAPVSGSTAAATDASLLIIAGGSDEDFADAERVLRHAGREVRHVGARGDASLLKLAINNLIYGINGCVSEALVLVERAGLDRDLAYDAFVNSAAGAPVLSYRREQFLDPAQAPVSFTIALEEKDLRLTTELADQVGAPMPQARVNREVARAAMDAGYAEADVASVAEYLRRKASEGESDA